jgi:hypothetical protein
MNDLRRYRLNAAECLSAASTASPSLHSHRPRAPHANNVGARNVHCLRAAAGTSERSRALYTHGVFLRGE